MVSGLRTGTFYDYELFDTKQGKVAVKGRIEASASSDLFSSVGKGSVLYIRSRSNLDIVSQTR
jgi:hypothetical protein